MVKNNNRKVITEKEKENLKKKLINLLIHLFNYNLKNITYIIYVKNL